MCKFFGVINKDPANTETINQLLWTVLDDLRDERSGYSVLRHHTKAPTVDFYPVEYEYSQFVKNTVYKGEKTMIIHTRTSTGGESGIGGLHLQEIDGYYFAHNGFVSKHHGTTTKSDSYHFFKDLVENKALINYSRVKEIKEKDIFSGRALLFKPLTDELWAFGTSDIYLTVLKDCIIFSTLKIPTQIQMYNTQSVLGFSWEVEGELINIPILHQEVITSGYLYFNKKDMVRRLDNVFTYNNKDKQIEIFSGYGDKEDYPWDDEYGYGYRDKDGIFHPFSRSKNGNN